MSGVIFFQNYCGAAVGVRLLQSFTVGQGAIVPFRAGRHELGAINGIFTLRSATLKA
jgi:hypothetical protein